MKYILGKDSIKSILKNGPYLSSKDMLHRIFIYKPKKIILGEFDSQHHLIRHTVEGVYTDIDNFGEGLLSLNLKNKHIAICADNSYAYVVCDLAIIGGVGVSVPLDKDASEELLTQLLNKADVDAVFCSKSTLTKIKNIKSNLPRLKNIFTLDENNENFLSFREIKERGKRIHKKLRVYSSIKINVDDLCKIIFTSGTTGMNKGVMISQKNIMSNVMNYLIDIKVAKDWKDVSMSVLPMHHSTELQAHIYPRIAMLRTTYINDNLRNILNNMLIFKPNLITVVPMIANNFYKQIWTTAKKNHQTGKLKQSIRIYHYFKILHIDLSQILFKKVYQFFGGNIRQILIGGAMLNSKVIKGFNDLGIQVINGYGITECSPLIAANVGASKHTANSVGKPLNSVDIKLVDEDEEGIGEICVKGENVALGYYNDEEATNLSFDKDSYFHTGDFAKINNDGTIILSGRKKYAIVLDNGKNICPEEIENLIESNLSYVNESVVYSINRENGDIETTALCCYLYIKNPEIRNDIDTILKDIRLLNKKIPQYKQISVVSISDKEFTKTSTKKIKRDTIIHDEKIARNI